MKIDEFQSEAIEAIQNRLDKKGVKPNVDLTMTHLMEEFGEIASQINNNKLKRREVNVENIGEEISDCIMLLMLLAHQYDINLEEALTNKLNEVKNK